MVACAVFQALLNILLQHPDVRFACPVLFAADLDTLAKHLGEAYIKLEEHGSKDQFIIIDQNLHELIPLPLRSSIYVRRLYWSLLDKLKAEEENVASVVTGNPGEMATR